MKGRALSSVPEASRCRAQWLGPARAGPDVRRLIPTLLRQSRATCPRRGPVRHACADLAARSGSSAARALYSPPGCIAHRHYSAPAEGIPTQNPHSDSHLRPATRPRPAVEAARWDQRRRRARLAARQFRPCSRTLRGAGVPHWRPGGRPRTSPRSIRRAPVKPPLRRRRRVSGSVTGGAGFSWSRGHAGATIEAGDRRDMPRGQRPGRSEAQARGDHAAEEVRDGPPNGTPVT